MPEGTKVYRCVQKLKEQGYSESEAIRICQNATGESYQTGEKAEGGEEEE